MGQDAGGVQGRKDSRPHAVGPAGDLAEASVDLQQPPAQADEGVKIAPGQAPGSKAAGLPLGPRGPIEIDTEIRAMTLLELSALPAFIQQGKHVLLVLGPCGGCNRPKTGVLGAVLNAEPRLITHLVVDNRAAREFLGQL